MVKDVFIDGTERPTRRPQQGKSQRQHYSGRKKHHTKKNLLMTDDQQQILLLSPTKPGARTDYFRFKQSGFAEALLPEVTAWVDLGSVRVHKDYPHLAVMMPVKKPKNKSLTPVQRQENHLIRGIRIGIEHALAGVKRFRVLTDVCRNKITSWTDKFMLLACGLWNYHRRFA